MPNSLDFLKIDDIKSIETEKEKNDGYEFQLRSGNKARNLNDIKRINFFVGANNSGKSRFLRSIFSKPVTKIYSDVKIKDTFWKIYEEYKREISSFVKTNHNSKLASFASYFINSSFTRDKLLDSLPKIVKEMNQLDFIGRTKPPNLLEGIQKINEKYQTRIGLRSPHLIEYIYIPVLRGLRKLSSDESSDKCYYERTIKDYFTQENIITKELIDPIKSDPKKDVFTGLSLYEDVKKQLRGLKKDRDKIREYEEFLSENFFENKPINLVPHIESDVLYIKIGDDDDFPIYQVGDGIQQLIILTYPLFKNIGKNMFIFMEEPELFLHPGLQRRFIEILQDKRFDTFKFFIATHSNNFLDLSIEEHTKNISIYTFRKNEDKFIVKNVASGENNILHLLGARNSSMFMSNCTIWVEGITDRIYLRSHIKAYEDYLKYNGKLEYIFKEGVHYSFFEYAGSNLSHYIFDNPEEFTDEIRAQFLSNRIILIADKDEGKGKKHTKYKEMEMGNNCFIYKKLPVREIENLIKPETLKTVLPDFLPSLHRSNPEKIENFDITDLQKYRNDYLGNTLKRKLGVGNIQKTSIAKSGTLSTIYKKKLAELISEKITWETMSVQAQNLTKDVYEFIKESNK